MTSISVCSTDCKEGVSSVLTGQSRLLLYVDMSGVRQSVSEVVTNLSMGLQDSARSISVWLRPGRARPTVQLPRRTGSHFCCFRANVKHVGSTCLISTSKLDH
jgi:hypothetical protein